MEAGAGTRLSEVRAAVSSGSESVWATRLRVAGPRYLALAVMVVLLALGVRSLVAPPQPPAAVLPHSADAPSEDFALQFARTYLTYSSRQPQARTQALAHFLPTGIDRDAGVFIGSGKQRVRWAEVASDQPAVTEGRVITVAAGVSTQTAPVYLAVTVSHAHGGPVSLVGYPSFVGAPVVSTETTAPSYEEVTEPGVVEVVERVLRNYLAGSIVNLKADLTNDAVVTLPTFPLRLERVDGLGWVGSHMSGAIMATVTASDSRGTSYTLTYEVGLAYRERPYVDFVGVIPTGS
ncbi:MAG: conjugal transfer protein [Solirubrobacterales bacterium]